HIITGYTRESGVRELNRVINRAFRKIARRIAEGEEPPAELDVGTVDSYLGPRKYIREERLKSPQVGVATGLAWTPVGGELLTLEVALTRGKGGVSLTGQLGEVMRESAQAALTFVQANAEELGIDSDFLQESNVHIHLPQGAIPKDGPSAGVAIATALISILTSKPVSNNVAMTGEITLRGNVLEIGGLKEKALAAMRAGIPVVVMPKENEREIERFPQYLREKVTFIPISHVSEALEIALLDSVGKPLRPKRRMRIRI
ncbi:MAG: endopeptidase La, partial [Bdellovibrionales bacterium]|nr:endopeptidase La [Bdellovibrionales bacterium]